jgi:hypothetical protein
LNFLFYCESYLRLLYCKYIFTFEIVQCCACHICCACWLIEMIGGLLLAAPTLLQGLRQNSNICIWWMSQDQTTGLTEFSDMCMSTRIVDISNTFQYPQWNFPTLSNMNICRNFPKYSFTHSGIFQHFPTYIEESPLCWFLASDVCYFQSNSSQSRNMTKKLF